MKYGEVYSAEMTAKVQLNKAEYNRKSRIEMTFNPAFWCGRRDTDLLRKSGIFDTRLATGPVKDFGAENSSPNCFLNAEILWFESLLQAIKNILTGFPRLMTFGGESGIRTHGARKDTTVFKTVPL